MLQDRERIIQELEGEKNEEINRLHADNAELDHKIHQISYLMNKYKSELADKENLIGRSYQDNDH